MKAMNHIVVILALILALGCASVKPAGSPGAEISPDWPVMVWGTNGAALKMPAYNWPPPPPKDWMREAVQNQAQNAPGAAIYSAALVDIDLRTPEQIAAGMARPALSAIPPSIWVKLLTVVKGRIRILCFERVQP